MKFTFSLVQLKSLFLCQHYGRNRAGANLSWATEKRQSIPCRIIGGHRWAGVDRGGQRWAGVDRGGQRWAEVGRGGQRWTEVGRGGHRWAEVDRGGQRWAEVGRGGQGWTEVGRGGQRWACVGRIRPPAVNVCGFIYIFKSGLVTLTH
jgi:hypothetical protein